YPPQSNQPAPGYGYPPQGNQPAPGYGYPPQSNQPAPGYGYPPQGNQPAPGYGYPPQGNQPAPGYGYPLQGNQPAPGYGYPTQVQPPYYPQQGRVIMNAERSGPSMLIRSIWFIFIGSWLGFFWLSVGYSICLTVLGLPLGLVMLNRLPAVMTLRPRQQEVIYQMVGNGTMVSVGNARQQSMLVRTLYFIFVGWWLGFIWSYVAYALCLIILGLPLGLMMLNRLPAVLTLRK
ncbi:MAG: hypothetical protein HXX20_16995, partial [Chloroflexi bacterium]|nr:hypothetical protein [Chloroflexota bacterium]